MQEGPTSAIEELLEIASEWSLRECLLHETRPCVHVCDEHFLSWFSNRGDEVPGLRLAPLSRPEEAGAGELPWILCTLGDERSLLGDLRRAHSGVTVLGLLHDVLPRAISRLPVRQARQRADRHYMVLSIPRSGSYHLCGLLEGAGIGAAREHLRSPVCELARLGRIVLLDWLDNLASCVSVNGWFGTKVISHYLFEALDSGMPPEDFVRHVTGSGYRVLRIVRRDKVQQAVSHYFGRLTDVWTRGEDDPVPERPAYDFEEILSDYEFLQQQEGWLQRAVDRLPEVHTIHYEDLTADPDGTMTGVCEWLGASWRSGVKPRTSKQRDAYSLEVARRFSQDLERR